MTDAQITQKAGDLQMHCWGNNCNSNSIWGVRTRCRMEGSAHEQRCVADSKERKRCAQYQAKELVVSWVEASKGNVGEGLSTAWGYVWG